jgi:hypothetical protein
VRPARGLEGFSQALVLSPQTVSLGSERRRSSEPFMLTPQVLSDLLRIA